MTNTQILKYIEDTIGIKKIYNSDDLLSILNNTPELGLEAYEAVIWGEYKVMISFSKYINQELIDIAIEKDLIKLTSYIDIDQLVETIVKLMEKKKRIVSKLINSNE